MEKGKADTCKRRLIGMGFSETEAITICGSKFLVDNVEIGEILAETDSEECISRKIRIIKAEHKEMAHDQQVAIAISWCKTHGYGDGIIEMIKRVTDPKKVRPIRNTHIVSVIKNIISNRSLKVPHMGLLPFKTELPMKNLNKLQVKLERQETEEEKFLTAEQLERRKQYAQFMKKGDTVSEYDEFIDLLLETMASIRKEIDVTEDDILNVLFAYPENVPEFDITVDFVDSEIEKDTDWHYVTSLVGIDVINDGLNNVIKFPVILTREMVQQYGNEWHFKPYEELVKSIEGIEKIPLTIEHQDVITENNTIGYVKELRSDESIRGIRGVGYLYANKVPIWLVNDIKDKKVKGVSIGFVARAEKKEGEFKGKVYDHIQRSMFINHLAITVSSKPRCPEDMCGINLEVKDSVSTIKSGQNYYINQEYNVNICKLKRQLRRKETKDSTIKNSKEVKTMPELKKDSLGDIEKGKISSGEEPKDFEAFYTRLRKFMQGEAIENTEEFLKRMEKVKPMPEPQKDGEKDTEIAKLKRDLEDMKGLAKKLNDSVKLEKIDVIKKFSKKKYNEEALNAMSLDTLTVLADSVSDFSPSDAKPDVIPMASTQKPKEELSDAEKKRKVERLDLRTIFDDVNKGYNLQRIYWDAQKEERGIK